MLTKRAARMFTTVHLRKELLQASKDPNGLLANLSKKYPGRWVAILSTGEVIAEKNLQAVHAKADRKSAQIVMMLRAPKKDELLLR